MRRLSGSNSDPTEWRSSSLSSPPHTSSYPPPSPGGPSGRHHLSFPKSEEDKSPPHHGPLSPLTVPIPDCTETGGFTTPGSSPPIGSWDNYLDRSSYELGEDQFWHVRHNTWKIPIVTTDISDLELTASSSETSEVSDSVFLVEEETMAPSEGCNNAAKGLVAAKINLLSRIEVLDPDDIDQSFLHTIPGELDSIRDLLADFFSKIISFQSDFSEELDPSVVSSWQEEKKRVKKLVLDHKKLAWAKYTSLCPVKTLSHFEEQSLRNQTKQLVLQEASVGKTVGVEEKRILGIAEVKYQALVNS